MAISNFLFPPTSENPPGFPFCVYLQKFALAHTTTRSRHSYAQAVKGLLRPITGM